MHRDLSMGSIETSRWDVSRPLDGIHRIFRQAGAAQGAEPAPDKSWQILANLGKSWQILENLGKSWQTLRGGLAGGREVLNLDWHDSCHASNQMKTLPGSNIADARHAQLGWTALHFAAREGKEECGLALSACGANLEATNPVR